LVDPVAAVPEEVDALPLFVEEVVVLGDPLVVAAASVAEAPPARVLGGNAVLACEDCSEMPVSVPFEESHIVSGFGSWGLEGEK
jgi:hypothetical protein